MSARLDEKVKEYVKKFGEGISFGYHNMPEDELLELIEKAMSEDTPLPEIENEFDQQQG